MRPSPQHIAAIRHTVAHVAGPAAVTRVFGSRIDDRLRGGDIDLLVELQTPVDSAVRLSARDGAALQQVMGDQRIDVLIFAPNLPLQAIHRIARDTGIEI